jgi:predicted lactoylglutathione lyase
MRMIFVNLPVKDLEVSRRFFTAIGFELDPEFSDDSCACMVVDQNIFVMLLVEDRFGDFVHGETSDASRSTEVITCLSAGSRQEVDETLARALAAGGKPWQPVREEGPMYGASFADPDGHVWEVLWMDLPAA